MAKKVLLIIGVIVSILLIGIYLSYDYWLEKQLRFQLSEIINKDPNSLYAYKFDNLNIDLVDGSVDLTGISITPTQAAFDSLAEFNNSIRFLTHIQLDQIELKSFEIRQFLRTNTISVEALIITKPIFTYYFHPNKEREATPRGLSAIFSDKFKGAELGKLLLKDGMVIIDNYNDSIPALTINSLDIELNHAQIDSTTISRFFPFDYDNIDVRAASIDIEIANDFSITSDSLLFNANTESLTIKDFQIKPKYSRENFANAYNMQKQWFAVTLRSLELNDININRFVRSGTVELSNMIVNKPNIALYKDKSKPTPPFKKKLLPASAIRSIPWRFDLDTITFIDGYIAINETSDRTGLDSHLSIYNLNGMLTNFTNDPMALNVSPIMELNASADIYNKAATNINMAFDLMNTDDEFKANGSVGAVDAITFNPVLEPIMAIKASAGKIERIEFQFSAMDTLSTGTLDMEYNDVKLEVLNADTSTAMSKKGLLSFAANTIIRSNNTKANSGYTQGIINTTRELEKDVWPFLWHSLQSGIVSTMVPMTNSKKAKELQKQYRKELRETQRSK
jgi:hypothetical protein